MINFEFFYCNLKNLDLIDQRAEFSKQSYRAQQEFLLYIISLQDYEMYYTLQDM